MKNTDKLRVRKVKSVTNPVMKGLLKTSLAVGLVGTAVVAPNALQAIDFVVRQVDKQNKRGKRFSEYAQRSGYFEIERLSEDRYCVRLSKKGVKAAQDVLFQEYELPKKQKWDGHWHMLMFDIAEKHKYLRDALSNRVDALGMKLIQNSVYVYPYDITEFTQNVQAVYPEAMQYVLHAEVIKLDGEDQLIKAFHESGAL